MNAGTIPSPRLRALLDLILAVALVLLLVLTARDSRAQARAQRSLPDAAPLAVAPGPLPQTGPPVNSLAAEPPGSGLPSLDANTLAAVIAAENAALMLPMYGTHLPVITK